MTIKPQNRLWTNGSLCCPPFVAHWLLFRFWQRNQSLLMWEQSGERRDLIVSEPAKTTVLGNETTSQGAVTVHMSDRVCVSVLPSTTAGIAELLAAPHGEIYLSSKIHPREMRPLQVSPEIRISIECAKVDFEDMFSMWPTPQCEQTYIIEGTSDIVRGRMSPRNYFPHIPSAAFPVYGVHVGWNFRSLYPRSDEGEQWSLGTGLESVTRSDVESAVWLERSERTTKPKSRT
jgi:hypothetical protein